MLHEIFRFRRMGSFVYPIQPVPRTAVLVPWFRESFRDSIRGSFGCVLPEYIERPVRVFPAGWSREAAEFRPQAIAATPLQIRELERIKAHSEAAHSGNRSGKENVPGVAPTHAIIVLHRPGGPRLPEAERDRIWRSFHVPVFEQIIGRDGELLAGECEAHDGLHADHGDPLLEYELFDFSPCPCGRRSPRIRALRSAMLERSVAAWAR